MTEEKKTFNLTKYGRKFKITVNYKHKFVYGKLIENKEWHNPITYTATARCAPEDTFNETTGIAIVIKRLINIELGNMLTVAKRYIEKIENIQSNINKSISTKYNLNT